MREGALTEKEWHKQAGQKPRPGSPHWGAQCMAPQIQRMPKQRKISWRAVALLAALSSLGLSVLFLCWPHPPQAEFSILPALSEAVTAKAPAPLPTAPTHRDITYGYPKVPSVEFSFSKKDLMRGKILLVSQEHPLPTDLPGANTVTIATYGKGIVPVRDLALQTGPETIDALYQFFVLARQKGMEGLAVFRGALSEAQQREWQLERVRVHSASMPMEQAVQKARQEVDDPRASDLQQQYTVDIRLFSPWEGAASQELYATAQGRFLLQNIWRYGFIRRFPGENVPTERATLFRYVGLAHSTAMTYLDLSLEQYLALLHEKKALQIMEGGVLKYLILCLPLTDGYVNFPLPEGTAYEAGYDNLGYAVVACTFPGA